VTNLELMSMWKCVSSQYCQPAAPRATAFLASFSALFIGLTAIPAVAQTGTWKTSTTNGSWATTGNWNGGVPGTGNTATFSGTSNNQTIVTGTITLGSLLFDTASVGAYTVGGAAAGTGQITLDNNGSITVTASATNSQTINAKIVLGASGTISNSASGKTLSLAGGVTGASTGTSTLTIAGPQPTTINGAITDGAGGALGITITSAGNTRFNGANTFTGPLTIAASAGAFNNDGASSIPTGAAVTFNGASWGLNNDITVGALSGTNASSFFFRNPAGAKTITVGSGNASSSFAGSISDNNPTSTINVGKIGSGTWSLSNAGSTYAGTTTISAGTVEVVKLSNINTASSIGKGSSAGAATDLVLAGGILRYTGSGDSTNRLFSTGTAGGGIDASGAAALVFTGTGPMGFNSQSGARTLTLSGTSTANNALAVAIGDSGGATSLSKSGAGLWILTGTNGYSGSTTVNGGTLQLGSDSTAAPFATSGTIALAGTLRAHNGTLTLTNNQINITGASGNLTTGASGTISVSGVTFANQAGTNVAVTAPMVVGAGGLTVAASSTSSGAWVNLSGNLSGSGAVTLDSQGLNTFQLTGSNSFAGGIVASSGYWHGGQNSSVPVGSAVTNNGTWGVTGDAIVGNFSGNGGIFNTNNATLKTLTIGSGNASSSYSGGIGVGNNLAVVKTASGTFSLSAAWRHDGGTTINGGMLSVASAGALSGTAGSVTINGGELKYNSATALTRPITFTAGTLSGTGTIGTAVTVGVGNILSPGNSPGVQSYTSGLTFGPGGQYTWEINNWAGSAGTGYDQLAVSGSALNITATSGTTFTIAVTGLTAGNTSGAVPNFGAGTTGTSFTIATSSTGISGFDKTKFTVDTSGFTNNNTLPTSAGFWVSQSGSNLLLNYAPSATRSLAAATSAAQIIVGGTATISASVTNAGNPANSPDALSFTGLSVGNGVSLGSTGGSGITAGGTSATSGAFTTVTAGTYTFTPSVATATNTNIGTNALTGSTSVATVTVLDHATSSLSNTAAVLSAVLDLGTWDYGSQTWTSGSNTGTFFISNLASLAGASLTADLSLTGYTANGGGFSTNLSNYADILGGQSSPFTISVDPSLFLTSGTQSKTFTLTMADKTGLSGGTNTNTLTVAANVVVVPEPSAAILAGMAVLTAGWVGWRRRSPVT
jgi:fibronectin-binding autotransporter adhesin